MLRLGAYEGRLTLPRFTQALAVALVVAALGYVGWKAGQSSEQALQFAFNGLSVGAIYALLAMGFTLVYSTVWFFDLYYGAAAAMGAYGVFYLQSQSVVYGRYDVSNLYVNIVFAAVTAGVTAWAFRAVLYSKLRPRVNALALRVGEGALAVGVGAYVGLMLAYPQELHVSLAPAVGILTALAVAWALRQGSWKALAGRGGHAPLIIFAVAGAVAGAWCGLLLTGAPGARLYLSWGVSCLLTGAVSLALYRGLYVYMRQRARSPLVMLVATLGILLAITAFITIVFQSAARPLPDAFGSAPWTVAGAHIKGFTVFTIGVAVAGFIGLLLLLKKTSLGRAVRAIGDDEEVSKVVGINTTLVIAVVFFIGAVFAALAGVLSGHDTAIQPRMGLLLLLKGWVASVVGGMGNIYGAIVGGFTLGMIEQFGIWDLAGEWKEVISFILLVLFLSFWPKGMLPRK